MGMRQGGPACVLKSSTNVALSSRFVGTCLCVLLEIPTAKHGSTTLCADPLARYLARLLAHIDGEVHPCVLHRTIQTLHGVEATPKTYQEENILNCNITWGYAVQRGDGVLRN